MNTPTSINRVLNINDMAGIVLSSIPAKNRAAISNQVPLSPGTARFMNQIYRLREIVEHTAPIDLSQERVAQNAKNIKNINRKFIKRVIFL